MSYTMILCATPVTHDINVNNLTNETSLLTKPKIQNEGTEYSGHIQNNLITVGLSNQMVSAYKFQVSTTRDNRF